MRDFGGRKDSFFGLGEDLFKLVSMNGNKQFIVYM
jgi:hypothetical protein